MIKLTDITFRHKGAKTPVFEDFSLEIQSGEFVVLVGDNGSGKSTLARLIAGVIKPRRGMVAVNDINTKDKKRFFELRQTISIVLQNPENNLLFDKVADDIKFGLLNLRIPKGEHNDRIAAALEKVGLPDFEKRSTYELSFGQKQRVAIAGILAMGTSHIVLDEPTAMLDTDGKREIYDLLWDLNAQGFTIILTTNIESETKKGRIIRLSKKGEVKSEK